MKDILKAQRSVPGSVRNRRQYNSPYGPGGGFLKQHQLEPHPDKSIMLSVVLISVNLTKHASIDILSQRSELEKSLVN